SGADSGGRIRPPPGCGPLRAGPGPVQFPAAPARPGGADVRLGKMAPGARGPSIDRRPQRHDHGARVARRRLAAGAAWVRPGLGPHKEVLVVLRIVVGLVLTVAAFALAGRRLWWLARVGRSGQAAAGGVAAGATP